MSIIIPSFNNHVQLSNRIAVAAKATVFVLFLLHVITAPLTGRPVFTSILTLMMSYFFPEGACIAIAYAIDRDTIRKLGWSSIKVSEQT